MSKEQVVVTAIEIAAQTGRLDFLNSSLAILTVLLGLGGLFSVFVFRSDVRTKAAEIAKQEAGKAVKDYLSSDGGALVKAALDDAEVVARLQIELSKLGLDDTENAETVDSDPDWKPENEK